MFFPFFVEVWDFREGLEGFRRDRSESPFIFFLKKKTLSRSPVQLQQIKITTKKKKKESKTLYFCTHFHKKKERENWEEGQLAEQK